jgi:hypothetical protein
MKKLMAVAILLIAAASGFAQTDSIPATTSKPKKDWSKTNLGNRPNDHLLLQVGYDGWAQKPDSMHTTGLSRSFNAYFMLDFPFKTDPRFSVGIGAGVSTSSIYFSKTIIGIAGNTTRLTFKNVADTNYYKKYKLSLAYLEVPLELRFSSNPEHPGKSLKFAIGGKIGTLVNAHTKGKNLLNKAGTALNTYTVKENSKRYFNGTRLSGTARIGYGNFSLFGSYQITTLLKDVAGPPIHPYSVGLTLSGI